MWRSAALELGADLRRLSPQLLEIRLGDAVARIGYEQTTPFTDRVSYELASDKPCAYRVLREAGISVPEHIEVSRGGWGLAQEFLGAAPVPLVVKPARGGGGVGVVGQIAERSQLRQALTNAWRYEPRALVERQVPGDVVRLLLLDGELLDAVRRDPPRVHGDGKSSLKALVVRESERRIAAGGTAAGFPLLELDLDSLFVLQGQGYGLDSVLVEDEWAQIKVATNAATRESSQTVCGSLNLEVVIQARRAAAALGVRLAGVDVVVAAAASGPEAGAGTVLEVNPIPGLTQHYNVEDPTSRSRVAVPVLAALLGARTAA